MSVVRNKVFSRGSIFTPGERRRIARRLDRRVAGLNAVLADMHRGESLHLKYRGDGRPCWTMSNGRAVRAEVASTLINIASIEPVDAALFFVPAQTWKLGGNND